MNGTLEKFLNLLNEIREKNFKKFRKYITQVREDITPIGKQEQVDKIFKKIEVIENFIKLFCIKNEDWEKHRVFCKDFDILSEILLELPLSMKERSEIIFLLAQKNIKGNLLNNASIIINYPKIQKHKFNTLTKEDVKDEYAIYKLLVDDENINNLNEEQKEELKEFAKKHILDISDIQKYHAYIQEHYFEKKNTYQDFDIIIVLRSLKELGVNEELLKIIKYILEKDLNNRKKKQQLSETKIKIISLPTNSKVEIRKQIENVVDLRNMIPKNNITYKQILEYISLMLELGYPQENIYEFLRNAEIKRNCSNIHPITRYIEEYERLKYYEDKLVLFDELKNLEEYFQMLWITNDEDYYFWKKCFQDELNNYIKSIPGGFDYELKSVIKKKEKRKLEINLNS